MDFGKATLRGIITEWPCGDFVGIHQSVMPHLQWIKEKMVKECPAAEES